MSDRSGGAGGHAGPAPGRPADADRAGEEPLLHAVDVDGVRIACHEWRPECRGAGPSVLLAHATGFHARVWDPVLRRLPGRHVVAVDSRGHGRSDKPPITHWRVFGEDLAAVADAFDLRGAVGVGHSMGGHALVDAAAARPGRFARLILLDPVIVAPEVYGGGWTLTGVGVHPTAKRRRHFDSPEAMIERFRDRPPYAAFHPEALRAYCEHGLLPRADGEGFELACPPETEASVYMTSRTNADVYRSLRALEMPVLVVRAKEPPPERDLMDFSSSPTWPGLVRELRHGRELFLPDRSHFIPMESPDEVATWIEAELRAAEA